MLRSLYIRNYAIIDELTVEFDGGLNIITGETGAGKSILLDALSLILGERSASETVRQGATKAIVEGVFMVIGNEPVRAILRDNGYEDGDELIVRREISSKGGSRAFLNDSPASIHLLREVGDFLIDLHGQHEHQTLLRRETHLRLLDNAGGLERIVAEHRAAYAGITALAGEISSLRKREEDLRRKQEFYEFQLQEIAEVDPKKGEDEELEKELKIHENSEQIFELVSSLHGLLYEEANSVRDQLVRARSTLERLARFDPSFGQYRDECVSASVVIEEIAKSLQSYSSTIDFAPEQLEANRERLHALAGLRKKFGGTLDAVLEYRARITEEIELARNYDAAIEDLEAQLGIRQEEVGKIAARLSAKRSQVARKVERSVAEVLMELGIPNARFLVRIERHEAATPGPDCVLVEGRPVRATAEGIDDVEFFISTNLGEEPKPLARTASGGEISRVMLALKTILARNDRLPILVFDEIDVGISGRIASKVGVAMKNLGAYHQIVAITHLPQIAAAASAHYVVEKVERDGRTVTRIRRLDSDEHTREVAKLMSGETVTESSLQMARELIES